MYYSKLLRRAYDEKADAVVSFNEETDKQSGFEEMFGPAVRYLHNVENFASAMSIRASGSVSAIMAALWHSGWKYRALAWCYAAISLRRRSRNSIAASACAALVRDLRDLDRKQLNSRAKSSFDFARIGSIIATERDKLHDFLRSSWLRPDQAKDGLSNEDQSRTVISEKYARY